MPALCNRLICAGLLALVCPSFPLAAHPRCSLSTADDWLTKGERAGPVLQLSNERVRAVTQRLSHAIEMLKTRSAVPLGKADVEAFTGEPVGSGRSLHPYLARAVFPVPGASLDVRWDGFRLDVFAGGLGCAAYAKHPVIVFLERQPRNVIVIASAAL